MKSKLILIILSAILIAPAFSEDREFQRGMHTREVPGWKGRPYDLYIPAQYDPAKPWPVVLALHGGGGNSEHAIKITCPDGDINSPKCLDALADREGFIVVYPNGTPNNSFLPKFRTWNATGGINDKYRCIGGTACMENVDDIGYFRNLLDDLSGVANIDQDRIYATGISNGGAMAHRLACELSERIAAIAPVAAGNQYEAVFGCNPERPVPALEIHGLKDAQWPYEGGYGKPVLGQPRIAEREEYKKLMVPIRPSMANWAKRNNCATDPTIENFGSVIKETYTKCKDAADVVHYAIKDSGHTWPQGYQYFDESSVGKTCQDINANEVIWEFFKKHPRGGDGEKTPLTLGPGDYDFSLEHDGLTRTYKLHVPRQYDRRTQVSVVLYIHGGGGNARSAYLDKMDKSSDKFGFILAIPEATGEVKFGELRGSWNGGIWATGECCGSADDVGFIARMIEEIKSNFNVDEKRIYATGISNGGLMTNRIGCELSDKIAAIATVAPAAIPSGCKPLRPLPVMDIHGIDDTHNPFYGGEPSSAISRKVDYKRMMPAQVVGRWLDINGCVGEPVISSLNRKVTYSTYAQCKSGSEVVFVKVEDMGHAWPGGFESKLLGITPVSYDFSFDQIWEFFKKHPLEAEAQ